mmetsp:Transcript_45216/g.104831  ORF Transcript_45216/g.104831 Transcript_45216/m.104831 type:complete len:529 (+) Transcript_45216:121-1707(+)
MRNNLHYLSSQRKPTVGRRKLGIDGSVALNSEMLSPKSGNGGADSFRETRLPRSAFSSAAEQLKQRRAGMKRHMNEVMCIADEAYAPKGNFKTLLIGQDPMVSEKLREEELVHLTRVLGKMAPIRLTPPQAKLKEILQRVDILDQQLEDSVQGICDRLSHLHRKRRQRTWPQWVMAGIRRCFPIRFLRCGVIADIMPEILFYTIYTVLVQFYCWGQGWVQLWSAVHQDTIYYVGLVFAFLLGFRASDCMWRYHVGSKYVNEMEKALRGLAFEVYTKLVVDTSMVARSSRRSVSNENIDVPNSLKIRYFKHELRRMLQLLFACAARDLNDSAIQEEDFGTEEAQRLMEMSVTQVEHAAIHVTHSNQGHVFRVYVVAAWLRKLVGKVAEQKLFEDHWVMMRLDLHLSQFKEAWVQARQVAYSQVPSRITHLLWLLTNALNLTLVIEYVAVCQWLTIFPSLCITIACFGVLKVAEEMENPFGFDADDIPIWDVAKHLHEEISLIAYYAQLDEVGNENLYRTMMNSEPVSLC